MRRLVLILAAAALAVGLLPAAPASAAVAPGCTSARPTSLGGPVYGSDGRSLNVVIGIDLRDAYNRKVNPDGTVSTTAGYSYRHHVNPTIPAEGSEDRSLTRRWGSTGGGVLCLSAKVRSAWIELYPSTPERYSKTSKVRYGGAAHHNQPLVAGGRHDSILLRTPLRRDLGGITGSVHGYLSYQGKAIDPKNITRARAFPRTPGAQCGIEGFSASADQIAISATGTKTYYRLDYLAGGKCGAATQRYVIQIDCVCGGVKRTLSREVDVATGRATGLHHSFG